MAKLVQVYWISVPFCVTRYWQARAMLLGCKADSEGQGNYGSSTAWSCSTSGLLQPAAFGNVLIAKCLSWTHLIAVLWYSRSIQPHRASALYKAWYEVVPQAKCLLSLTFFPKLRIYSNFTSRKALCWFWYKTKVFPTNLWEKEMACEELWPSTLWLSKGPQTSSALIFPRKNWFS